MHFGNNFSCHLPSPHKCGKIDDGWHRRPSHYSARLQKIIVIWEVDIQAQKNAAVLRSRHACFCLS
ncbi:MAG: hypothetical protein CMN55_11600 [Sneathiella sp.]|nr:hypothetical protein [Sneathiella sp.]